MKTADLARPIRIGGDESAEQFRRLRAACLSFFSLLLLRWPQRCDLISQKNAARGIVKESLYMCVNGAVVR